MQDRAMTDFGEFNFQALGSIGVPGIMGLRGSDFLAGLYWLSPGVGERRKGL